MLFFVSSVKLVAEIALFAFAGQWLLGLLAGDRRETNLFYQLLSMLTRPFAKVARWVAPRIVLDRHVPLVAVLLLLAAWVASTLAKINICLQIGVTQCQ